jgi:hypothetical protein
MRELSAPRGINELRQEFSSFHLVWDGMDIPETMTNILVHRPRLGMLSVKIDKRSQEIIIFPSKHQRRVIRSHVLEAVPEKDEAFRILGLKAVPRTSVPLGDDHLGLLA